MNDRTKPRWYIAATTDEGYARFRARVMYVRKAWVQGRVHALYGKSDHEISQDEAKLFFNEPKLVADHLQNVLDDLWHKIKNND